MHKRLIDTRALRRDRGARDGDADWLTAADFACVEITSEDPEFPIENALVADARTGWRAAGPGRQTVRVHFAAPRSIRRIALDFADPDRERTQEYVLRWSADGGASFREILRQQWNFSAGAVHEAEDHHVELPDVTALELELTPDVGGGSAPASLAQLRVA